jgi:O-antigen ligase
MLSVRKLRLDVGSGLKALFASDGRSPFAVAASLLSALTLPLLVLHPQHVPVVGTFGQVTVRISDLAILVTLGVAVLVAAREKSLGRARPWLWLLPFVLLMLVSALVTEDSSAPVVAAAKLTVWLLYGVAVTLTMRTPQDVRLLVGCLAATALVFGVIGGAEVILDRSRAASLVGFNSLGLFGAFAFAVALAAPQLGLGRRLRWALAVGAGLCLISSASLGATVSAVATVAAAAIMGVGFKASLGRRLVAVGVVTAIALGTVAALRFDDVAGAFGAGSQPPALPAGTRGETSGSLAQRAMYADFGIRTWLERPLFGVGFQRSSLLSVWLPELPDVYADFPSLPDSYFPPAPGTPFQQLQPNSSFGVHTVYLQLLAELGVVGFVLFFLGVAGVTRRAWRGGPEQHALVLPLVAVLAGFIDHQFSGGVPDTTLFALALAFAFFPAQPAPVARPLRRRMRILPAEP